MLFHRLTLSKDKEGVLQLAQEGNIVNQPEDMLEKYFGNLLKEASIEQSEENDRTHAKLLLQKARDSGKKEAQEFLARYYY